MKREFTNEEIKELLELEKQFYSDNDYCIDLGKERISIPLCSQSDKEFKFFIDITNNKKVSLKQ